MASQKQIYFFIPPLSLISKRARIHIMTENPSDTADTEAYQQTDFAKITQLTAAEFKIEESLIVQGTPTYYLVWPQETKQAFLRLLRKLETMNLIAFLRKKEGRIILQIVPKPPVKPNNPKMNLILLLATVATTFITGYIGFAATGIDPLISGVIFSVAILLVVGIHEMGHKITANKKDIDSTSPYFIPGPPPLGTLGAVIMQKSQPRNRDTLFDVGANGPIAGFIVAVVFSAIGLLLLIPSSISPEEGTLGLMPLSWILLARFFTSLNLLPQAPAGGVLLLHPVTWAGWAGMIVTMLNLLPAAMLDGGHVARSALANEKGRLILTFASVALLLFVGTEFMIMAFLIVFMSMFKHPGPLDDVSGLSRSRKLLTVVLIAVFVLAFPVRV